ncbi:MAG: response regulator [Alphaproteobacteria bacterium]|nr:response regulator [Alphaproteobacteria bacterium]
MLSLNAPILVVDDDLSTQTSIEGFLKEAGYSNVHTASNGKNALDKIQEILEQGTMFKIILLDWDMPEMDGLTFLKACRGDLGLKDVTIIMISAFTNQKNLILALGCGADTFIPKPISGEALLRKIEQMAHWIDPD